MLTRPLIQIGTEPDAVDDASDAHTVHAGTSAFLLLSLSWQTNVISCVLKKLSMPCWMSPH